MLAEHPPRIGSDAELEAMTYDQVLAAKREYHMSLPIGLQDEVYLQLLQTCCSQKDPPHTGPFHVYDGDLEFDQNGELLGPVKCCSIC